MENKDWKKKFNEKFRNSAGSLITNDPYTFNEMSNFISTSITQAIAEERERVRETINALEIAKPNNITDEIPYAIKKAWLKETKQAILSSLDTTERVEPDTNDPSQFPADGNDMLDYK